MRLEALEELYLDSNQLECLPESLGNLVNLKELDILDNQIAELPKSFINLKHLEIFHAEGKTDVIKKGKQPNLPNSLM